MIKNDFTKNYVVNNGHLQCSNVSYFNIPDLTIEIPVTLRPIY